MIEPGQIIFMVTAIIALAALASMPSWWTAILVSATGKPQLAAYKSPSSFPTPRGFHFV